MALFKSLMLLLYELTILLEVFTPGCVAREDADLQVYTVATNETDGYKDFVRSCSYFEIPLKVLGFGEKWKGGNMNSYGGGHKINLLKEALEEYKHQKKLILFTDSYDVLFLSSAKSIAEKFLKMDAGIVFSAEVYCWPDINLAKLYPESDGYQYLNSGGFIGYSDLVYKMVTSRIVKNTEDDQLFYTHIYLNDTRRSELNIKLDHKAQIFQNLYGARDDVKLEIMEEGGRLFNMRFSTEPSVLHGNGFSKRVDFRSLSNYLAGRWTPKEGCRTCDWSTLDLNKLQVHDYPIVVIGVFIERPTPFLQGFLSKIAQQTYPKKKIHLLIRNSASYHGSIVDEFLSIHRNKYRSTKLRSHKDHMDQKTARTFAIDYCVEKKCEAFLYIESDAHLDNPDTLAWLIERNRSIVAPLLYRPYKSWSNFWGGLGNDGYYARSFDYMDIVRREKQGLWNVPFVGSCYLVKADVLKHPDLKPSYSYRNMDYDMGFCASARDKGLYMYVDNRKEFGHLVDLDNFNISRTNPEMYELFSNRWDWENKYLHQDYKDNFGSEYTFEQPCPDVYWFPIVSPQFCKEFVEIMEAFGQWSDGSHNDTRLKTGYEAVPTRDIHMVQVGLNELWLEFLKLYVSPLQEAVFIGYQHDPPNSLMNFVVRYRPDEQPSLRPHHDSSTYTINIALNRPNIDYQGGGCRFIRYNCAVTDMRLGWMLMHPGRLTHYHEGLPVTNGTRYIMISFVDP